MHPVGGLSNLCAGLAGTVPVCANIAVFAGTVFLAPVAVLAQANVHLCLDVVDVVTLNEFRAFVAP